jgi:hypothetical protein
MCNVRCQIWWPGRLVRKPCLEQTPPQAPPLKAVAVCVVLRLFSKCSRSCIVSCACCYRFSCIVPRSAGAALLWLAAVCLCCRVWQNRPLSEDLITCAAADVTYLLPLMEIQVTCCDLGDDAALPFASTACAG